LCDGQLADAAHFCASPSVCPPIQHCSDPKLVLSHSKLCRSQEVLTCLRCVISSPIDIVLSVRLARSSRSEVSLFQFPPAFHFLALTAVRNCANRRVLQRELLRKRSRRHLFCGPLGYDNLLPGKGLGRGEWKRLHNEELQDLYC
jgi:hypothetical protein